MESNATHNDFKTERMIKIAAALRNRASPIQIYKLVKDIGIERGKKFTRTITMIMS